MDAVRFARRILSGEAIGEREIAGYGPYLAEEVLRVHEGRKPVLPAVNDDINLRFAKFYLETKAAYPEGWLGKF